ncbi:SpoIID/LytB domain-containing protein [Patescibacteria group bacterium]|nr:SpoIID/LytB domain-containing protein [Patescibacteria group bacterium]
MRLRFFPLMGIILISLLLLGLQASLAESPYQAQRIGQSHASIPELSPGQSLSFWVKFKNIGSQCWQGSGAQAVTLRTINGGQSKFSHPTWYNSSTPNRINPVLNICSGQETLFRFKIEAPSQVGTQWEKFNLFAGSDLIPGGEIEIAIQTLSEEKTSESTSPGSSPETIIPEPEIPEETETPDPETFWQTIPTSINIKEKILWPNSPEGPNIRVGLLYIENNEKENYLPLKISSFNQEAYEIRDQNNRLLIRNTEGESLKIDYDYQLGYYFLNDNSGKRLLMTDSFLRLSSLHNDHIFRIDSWTNGPFWGQNVNDNLFRGDIEIQFNPSTKRLWLINELPLEKYMRGVAEVSDLSSAEFLKAQKIAARTYALFRLLNHKYTNTPNNEPLFDLRSTQADQVYRGYNRELRAPRTLAAVEATRSIIATYDENPILAYYFSTTDGSTRSSYEARMTAAPVPYLQARPDPPGIGRTMLGHGVGLPQIGGIVAANQGANYSQILRYYYTGIDLTKMY